MANPKYQPFKRLIDIVGSIVALILLSWLFLLIAILIKLFQGGKVFYKQDRVGLFGKKFKIYKFTSMEPNADQYFKDHPKELIPFIENGYKFPDGQDPRVTKLGNFLRRTTLDEIPQFVNILKGDMSIVGPRPIQEPEIKQYGKFAEKLFSVRPGAMGAWQANGRSDLTYQQRVNIDMAYIDEIGFWNDIKTVLHNIIAIFRGEGAY